MLPCKHRARACTHWSAGERVETLGDGGELDNETAELIKKLHAKAEAARTSGDLATRQKLSRDAEEQTQKLRSALQSAVRAAQTSGSLAAGARLRGQWQAAASPARRTGQLSECASQHASEANKKPLPLQEALQPPHA